MVYHVVMIVVRPENLVRPRSHRVEKESFQKAVL